MRRRLAEPRRFIQVVCGPRQVSKTTLVGQVVEMIGAPCRFVSDDEPALRGPEWIAQQWEAARLSLDHRRGGLLVLDEVQKAADWAESVKRLWDEDTRARHPLKVVLLGSAPLLIQNGQTESLAGRFEVLHLPHWSFEEMRLAFGYSLEQHLYFGGYPGAGLTPDEVKADSEFYGRLAESAVGAHLANAAARGLCQLFYWRENNREVDFVLRSGKNLPPSKSKAAESGKRCPE